MTELTSRDSPEGHALLAEQVEVTPAAICWVPAQSRVLTRDLVPVSQGATGEACHPLLADHWGRDVSFPRWSGGQDPSSDAPNRSPRAPGTATGARGPSPTPPAGLAFPVLHFKDS